MVGEYNDLLRRARESVERSKPADALMLLLKAVSRNRHGVQAHCDLAAVWKLLGRLENAEAALLEALRWHSAPAAQTALAQLERERGRLDRAAELATAALRQAPADVSALLVMAEIEIDRGATDRAFSYLSQATSREEINAMHWPRLDAALCAVGETAAAAELFSRLGDRTPPSGQRIVAGLALALLRGDALIWEKWTDEARNWRGWTEEELVSGLLRLNVPANGRSELAIISEMGRRYRDLVGRRLSRHGGIGWPKRAGGEEVRVGFLCAGWIGPVQGFVREFLVGGKGIQPSVHVYCLEETAGASSDRIEDAVVSLGRLGSFNSAQTARLIAEDDCDVLFVAMDQASRKGLEVLSQHPAPLVLAWRGLIFPAACGLVDEVQLAWDVASLEHANKALSDATALDGPSERRASFWRILRDRCRHEAQGRGSGSLGSTELRAIWQRATGAHRGGKAEDADQEYSSLLADQPLAPTALFMRGSLRRDAGSKRAALVDFASALAVSPSYVDAALAVIDLQMETSQWQAAAETAAAVLARGNDDARLWRTLGIALSSLKQNDLSDRALFKATELSPGDALNWFHYGMKHHHAGRMLDAIDCLQKAAVLDPRAPETYFNLGVLHQYGGAFERAANCFEHAQRLRPEDPQIYKNLGEAYFSARNYRAWLANFRRFEERCPTSFALAANALEACQFVGDWVQLEHYLRGLAQQRFQPATPTELTDGLEEILYLLLFFDCDVDDLARFYRTYAEVAIKSYGSPLAVRGERKNGRVRVGYLSGDVRDHVMGKMIFQWLSYHDRSTFETFLYSTRQANGTWAEKIGSAAEHFCSLDGLDDGAAVRRMAEDDLDLLIDCSTHTRGARQAILAAKPARVQITSIASAGCLGMTSIDFKLTDHIADLPEMQQHQVEPFLAMAGCVYPYRPIEVAQKHPYRRERLGIDSRAFVIGAFFTFLKLSRRCLKAWREVLDRLPHAIVALSPVDAGQRDAYRRVFQAAGIDGDRLVFIPQGRNEAENQARYTLIDIVLDPMPFGGANGTIEALDMGVPVVTLCGRRHGERVGTSILTNLGVTSTIAHSGPEYVDLACRLAIDPDFANEVRSAIRSGISSSVFTDTIQHVRNLESAYLVALRARLPEQFEPNGYLEAR